MMLPLRIRKAEVALNDGRLEEAYQQAIRDDVRDHRKGQRLINRLTKAYEKRARVHLKSGNAVAAATDADRAFRLGGNQPDIIALRDEARYELNSSESAKRARNQKLAAARRYMATGDYSMGAKLCQDVEKFSGNFNGNFNNGNTVVGLMQDAEHSRRLVDSAIERGQKALKSAQLETAMDALNEAKRLQPSNASVIEFQGSVVSAVAKQVRDRITNGRLDQADMMLNRISANAGGNLDIQELTRVVAQCRNASLSSRSINATEIVANLKSLKHVIPNARWLSDAIKDAENVARSVENLRTGPLGSLLPVTESTIARAPQSPALGASPMPVFEATPVTPTKFMIHLDGAGSFLVLRDTNVTIGTQGRSRRVDVPLQGSLGSPTMSIERMDDDYFFTSVDMVPINGKKAASKLLTSNDQIRLGRRGAMQFTMPNAASTSATLDFSGIRLAAGNARRVILMDDALVIGPQASAHIQSLSMDRPMVIHWRDGELRIRPMSRSTEHPGATLVVDRPHDIDGLSLVVTKVSEVV